MREAAAGSFQLARPGNRRGMCNGPSGRRVAFAHSLALRRGKLLPPTTMDMAVRWLRDGNAEGGPPPLLLWQARGDAPAPMVMLLKVLSRPPLPLALPPRRRAASANLSTQPLHMNAGHFFTQALADLAAAVAQGVAHAAGLTVLALQQPPAAYQALGAALPPGSFLLLDGFSDPYSWWPTQHPGPASGLLTSQGLARLQALLLASDSAGHCVVIDGTTPLLDAHGGRAVAACLQAVRADAGSGAANGPASLLCFLDAEAHPPPDVAVLESIAAGVVSLEGCSTSSLAAAAGGAAGAALPVQGRLAMRLKRRKGRVRTQSDIYTVSADGREIQLTPESLGGGAGGPTAAAGSAVPGPGRAAEGGLGKPAGRAAVGSAATKATNPPAAATAAPAAPAAAAPSPDDLLAQRLGSTMRLGLSVQEAEARRRVQLPFEHQGQAAAHQAHEDFRDYLPREAGGRAAPGHSLGRILYVRDSESEADSDEDLDDDLEV